METILQLIDIQAGAYPEKPAFIFLGLDGAEISRVTYSDFRRQSRSFAVGLHSRLRVGDRTLLALPTGAELITAFFGCLYAGVLPILAEPPRHKGDKRNLRRLESVIAESEPRHVYVMSDAVRSLENLHVPPRCEIIVAGLNDEAATNDWEAPVISASSPAYLQFTSGSTAKPKGVVLTHENILANLDLIRRVFEHNQSLVTVSWLPLHHDMGLVGHVLQPLFVGGTSVLLSPAAFAREPLNWLRAISDYRAASGGGPPFAFDLCTRRKDQISDRLDLSCWRNAYVGAEPVSPRVLEAFADAYTPYGFRRTAFLPCYGLAEATLFAAGERTADGFILSRKSSTRELIGYSCHNEVQVRIIDPETGTEQLNGQVGEIWLTGRSVAKQYLRNGKASRDTFPVPAFAVETQKFLRTGDMGFVDCGFLYVTGRLKDLIIIRGVNHYPEDIEVTVANCRRLLRHEATVCFSVPGHATEELVVVQEIKPISRAAWPGLFEAVREAIALEHGLQVSAVILVRRGHLPRTTSGKLSRSATRDAYLRGELSPEAAWRSGAPKSIARRSRQRGIVADLRTSTEPIAIIGMACTFPKAENGPESYWSLLANSVDAIREVPPERWNVDLFYDPRPAVPGKMNTRWGGFIDEIEYFDAEFFGIPSHQAAEMDPQQRLVLEVGWRAFEHAGLSRERLYGSTTGVFIGISTNDYMHLQIKLKPGLDQYNAYSGLGNANSISANQLSYILNLRGPSMAIDTACSSSLTSLHMAARSLRNGECSMAIAGGVNAILSPGTTVTLSQFNMMSADGRCKVFDSRADGYVRSEGCGLVVLKKKSDAQRDRDNILAYLLGSAVGQNGRSTVITAPNEAGQRQVIEMALADAQCRPEDITLIEAHGTGTSIGDPAEVAQLMRIYGRPSTAGRCYLGAVKANIGHLEAAAGIAGVIKLILSLQHRQVAPQINLKQLNPLVALDHSRICIPTELTSWKPLRGKRVAAVSSFGFGGANAHAILSDRDDVPNGRPGPARTDLPVLFPLSGKSERAIRDQARMWIRLLNQPRRESIVSLAYSQSVRRTHFKRRVVFVAGTLDELGNGLASYVDSEQVRTQQAPEVPPKIAFLFSGQGAQYAGMGSELYCRFPVFKKNFDRCAAVFARWSVNDLSLQAIAFSNKSEALNSTLYLQPAMFALEYALAQLWISFVGLPAMLLGHSLGEYVAACVSGCFDVEEGMELIMTRARLMASIPTNGAMLATAASESYLKALLQAEEFKDVSIAAVNGENNTVLSGPFEEIMLARSLMEQRGFATTQLRTSQAFHSALMDEILEDFENEAAKIDFRPPQIPFISNVTGKEMLEIPDAAYWRKHLREGVRFGDGVNSLSRNNIACCIEIGPGQVLSQLIRSGNPNLASLPSLIKGDNAATILKALGEVYARGLDLRWQELYDEQEVTYVPDLPGHPFYRKRYWFDSRDHEEAPQSLIANGGANPPPPRLAELAYEMNWIDVALPDRAARQPDLESDTHWIIVGDGGGLASSVASQLRRRNQKVFRVSYQGTTKREVLKRPTGRLAGLPHFFVRAGSGVSSYEKTFRNITSRHSRAGASRWNVLYLRGLDATPCKDTTVASLERDQNLFGVGDLTSVVQALIPMAPAIRLWIVTENAEPIGIDGEKSRADLHPAQSPLWGFAHTLFLERPEMRGGVIDLEAGNDQIQQAEQVLNQTTAGDEPMTAFRSGARYAPRLRRTELKRSGEPVSLRKDGVYLITGGLGGLGLKCAEWMTARGAGHIVLLGRTPLPERDAWDELPLTSDVRRKVESIRTIERLGARVEYLSGDVTDHAQLTDILSRLKAGKGGLRGVVHAAGVNWFSKIAELDRQRLLNSLKTKVSAAWHLHEITQDCDLDFFILFSSVSAIWGSVDLAHYTAGNHFLDVLACERRRRGLHALSINWGPWSEVGMSAKMKETQLLNMLGFRLLAPDSAIAAMEALLAADKTRALVADIDWRRFRSFIDFSSSPALFADVREEFSVAESLAGSNTDGERDRIISAPPGEARLLLVDLVRRYVSAMLLLDPTHEVDVRQRFNLMGMDSLMAISFALRLEGITGVRLPSALVYNYPTIPEVADYLFELIRGETPPSDSLDTTMSVPAEPLAETRKRSWFPSTNGNGAAALRLFCFPYAGAGASIFRQWEQPLLPSMEVVPVQLPGREERADEEAADQMKGLSGAIADALLDLGPAPFAFFGHSFGAMIAFELTRELERRQAKLPERLFLSACPPPNAERPRLRDLAEPEFKNRLLIDFEMPLEAAQDEIVWQSLSPTLRRDISLLETYQPDDTTPLAVPITVLGGINDRSVAPEDLLAWINFTTADFSLRLFPGGHMFLKDHEVALLEVVREELRLSQRNGR